MSQVMRAPAWPNPLPKLHVKWTKRRSVNTPSASPVRKTMGEGTFRFSIDRGGTFTDIYAEVPGGFRVMKLLSEDPNYEDAPREGIRRILERETGIPHPADQPIDTSRIEWIRMGTTVATNALLERKGARIAFATTAGFPDLLYIGDQSRPDIFSLEVRKPDLLFERVVEIRERVRMIREDENLSLIKRKIAVGVSGKKFEILQEPEIEEVRKQLQSVLDDGIRSLAVSLLHSFTFRDHEQMISSLAKNMGFEHVSLSSELIPMVKIVTRGFTACADAYLTPCIAQYLQHFCAGFDQNLLATVKLTFMQSDGGLTSLDSFCGYRAILSGPAGGFIGYARTAFDETHRRPVCGFDMGGTSTDVSRYAGTLEHIFENVTAGITIQAPQLDINTVAAGGGSRLFFRSGMFVVGPESAGAYPGPACYRNGGPLTITDANLILGRIQPEQFPAIFGANKNERISLEAAKASFEKFAAEINRFYLQHLEQAHRRSPMTIEEIALGFIEVANETMCRPIRALTQARGFDITDHVLACFGGAGGQHCCAIARNLGIKDIFIHRFSGILSAYGMGLADVVYEAQEPCSRALDGSDEIVSKRISELTSVVIEYLLNQGFTINAISTHPFLNLRYEGTDTCIMTRPTSGLCGFADNFREQYLREYGFTLDRPLLINDIRVHGVGRTADIAPITIRNGCGHPDPTTTVVCHFSEGPLQTRVFELSKLGSGDKIVGPSIIIDSTSTIVIDPGCTANIVEAGDIRISVESSVDRVASSLHCDPVLLSIFGHRFMSIAEQMGRSLQRTSVSTNIKERLDFSCAIFGPNGGLVANAPHLPVHLGAMQEAVKFQKKYLGESWRPGDVILSNHPSAGGSHLPDITVITPVFDEMQDHPILFVASRGHHADIGGISPGSMPPFSKTLSQEGAAIMSFKLVENGVFNQAGISALLLRKDERNSSFPQDCIGTRNLFDNLSDLKAQVAANQKGIELIMELIRQYGLKVVHAYMKFIQGHAERAVREMLQNLSVQQGLKEVDTVTAADYMDDGSRIVLSITIDRRDGSALFDFSGTGTENYGNCNAPPAVTYSAIIYCLRCLVKRAIPLNQGCLEPITVKIPPGSMLCPSEGAAVVGGNVLTSQRITDVILRAFGACAASQGCMNNLTFGNDKFGYYETIAGGSGAGPSWSGRGGVHTHMTNTRITDPEIFESRYPVILRRFCLRPGSGGDGRFKGGDGVIREIEFLQPLEVGILSERRAFAPYGMAGGTDAKRGLNELLKRDGRVLHLCGRDAFRADAGDCIRIQSPGGGGYGFPGSTNDEDIIKKKGAERVCLSEGSIQQFKRLQESA